MTSGFANYKKFQAGNKTRSFSPSRHPILYMVAVHDENLMCHPVQNKIRLITGRNAYHEEQSRNTVLTRKTFIVLSQPTDIMYLQEIEN